MISQSKIPKLNKGDLITADWLNSLRDELIRQGNWGIYGATYKSTSLGQQLWITGAAGLTVLQITSQNTAGAWGTYQALPFTPTTPIQVTGITGATLPLSTLGKQVGTTDNAVWFINIEELYKSNTDTNHYDLGAGAIVLAIPFGYGDDTNKSSCYLGLMFGYQNC